MKIIRVEPVTSEDSTITIEYDNKHVYISADVMPIVCSDKQSYKLGEILQYPHTIQDTDQ